MKTKTNPNITEDVHEIGFKAVIDHDKKTFMIFITLPFQNWRFFPSDLAEAIAQYCQYKTNQGYHRL